MIEVIVKAGGQEIGNMLIERVEGTDDFDSINKYKAELRLHNIDKKRFAVMVCHRYGDEWPLLVQRALYAITARMPGAILSRKQACPHHD